MFVYNVTLNMEIEVEPEAKLWMEEEFIPYVMQSGLFHEYQLCKLVFQDQNTPAYAIQFYCHSEYDQSFLDSETQTNFLDMIFTNWGLQVMPFATMMDVIKPAYISFLHQN